MNRWMTLGRQLNLTAAVVWLFVYLLSVANARPANDAAILTVIFVGLAFVCAYFEDGNDSSN